MASLEDILKRTYTAKDCAFALQHGAFSNFRRDLTRSKRLFFPRKTLAAPGGGEYRYAHIFEMAVHIALDRRGGAQAKSLVWGLAQTLKGNDYGTKKLSDSPREIQDIIFGGVGSSGWDHDDFPEQAPGMSDMTQWLVDFPTFFLNEDFISRDPENPTYAFYVAGGDGTSGANVALGQNMTLMEAQEEIYKLRTSIPSTGRRKDLEQEAGADLSVLNLTTMLQFVDQRLKQRIEASEIFGA